MVKKLPTDFPFYFKKGSLIIYEDRIILPKMDNRVIYFSGIQDILFEKIDFTLYMSNPKNSFTIIYTKEIECITPSIPLSGYYALKKYYQKGKKSNGTNGMLIISSISLLSLLTFFVYIYASVGSR